MLIQFFRKENIRGNGRGEDADYPHQVLLLNLEYQEKHTRNQSKDIVPILLSKLNHLFHNCKDKVLESELDLADEVDGSLSVNTLFNIVIRAVIKHGTVNPAV